MRLRLILVPTDLSPEAEAAVKYATELAKSLGSKLAVFHPIEPMVMPGDLYVSSAIVAVTDQVEQAARVRVARLVERLKKRGLRCRGVVSIGRASSAIVAGAAKLQADLIIGSARPVVGQGFG